MQGRASHLSAPVAFRGSETGFFSFVTAWRTAMVHHSFPILFVFALLHVRRPRGDGTVTPAAVAGKRRTFVPHGLVKRRKTGGGRAEWKQNAGGRAVRTASPRLFSQQEEEAAGVCDGDNHCSSIPLRADVSTNKSLLLSSHLLLATAATVLRARSALVPPALPRLQAISERLRKEDKRGKKRTANGETLQLNIVQLDVRLGLLLYYSRFARSSSLSPSLVGVCLVQIDQFLSKSSVSCNGISPLARSFATAPAPCRGVYWLAYGGRPAV